MDHSFFAALAFSLKEHTNGWSASLIHKKLMMHFCEIMFCNIPSRFTTIQSILDYRHSINLNKACVLHPAIKLWISRINSIEPHLHHSPAEWYKAYPKLLKGLAFRFIYYHRNYETKPNRLFCMRVFAQLACEVFCCKIAFQPASGWLERLLWFYPLETADYYLKIDIPIVILQNQGNGNFRLCTNEVDPLLINQDTFELRLIKQEEEEEMHHPSFVLRRYTVENLQNCKKEHKNEQIGCFSVVAGGLNMILVSPPPPPCGGGGGGEECIYQIYPGDSSKTFYTIPSGKGLFVFLLHIDQTSFELAGQTAEVDQYLYFYMKHGAHCGVVVACAQNEQEAMEHVVTHTKYKNFLRPKAAGEE